MDAQAITLVLILIALGLFAVWTRSPRRIYPPGPKQLPILGNVLDVPLVRPWEKYQEWCEKYSESLSGILVVACQFTCCSRFRYYLFEPSEACIHDLRVY